MKTTEIISDAINLRVFRRNKRNIIIIWDKNKVPHYEDIIVQCKFNNEYKELDYSKFIPKESQKFINEVEGMVISHFNNNLELNKSYEFKITFVYSENERYFVVKLINGVEDETIPFPPNKDKIAYLYGYDYNGKKWVPIPVDYIKKNVE